MTVLIVTRSDDNGCIDAVRKHLVDTGVRSIRFDSDRFPGEVTLSTTIRGRDATRLITDGDVHASLDDVSAVWYRRFHAGARIPVSVGDMRDACVGESRRTALGFIAALPCFHLDPLESVRKTDHKELQLLRAAANGLDTPLTLISNNPDEVRAFARDARRPLVVKMQHSFAIMRDGVENVVFTNPLDDDALRELDGLAHAPMTFQELLDKSYELRVTVVGRQVFAARVDSQERSETSLDWRRDGVGLLNKWTPYDLPAGVSDGLLGLLAELGLNYGAADFVRTKDGRLVFLEVNAGGEYLWLDRVHPISAAIADTLVGRVARNVCLPTAWTNPPTF